MRPIFILIKSEIYFNTPINGIFLVGNGKNYYLGKRMIFTDLKSQKMPCNFWTNLEILTIVYIYILAEKTLTEKSLLGI